MPSVLIRSHSAGTPLATPQIEKNDRADLLTWYLERAWPAPRNPKNEVCDGPHRPIFQSYFLAATRATPAFHGPFRAG